MFAHSVIDHRIEQTAHEAFEIAWNFVSHSDDIGAPAVAQAFIATEIMRLLERGERHKIRLANLAISAFQTTRPIEREAALEHAYIG
jgi:hypothetical protein